MFCKRKLKRKIYKTLLFSQFFGNWGKNKQQEGEDPRRTFQEEPISQLCVIGETASLPLRSLSLSHCRNDSEGWL